ncbi:hypothetical protein FB451DRAFT_242881 [Mycena latifolia]|nr:hypothetical protein FB451DRAFT_242881 [Mycena latifolia]
MYFHNVATHRHPRVPPTPKLSWEPFHLTLPPPDVTFEPGRCLELYEGSVAVPRPSRGRAGTVYFQLPSNGEDSPTSYVLSWPPSIATPTLSSPSSASSSDSSSASVYYTPPNTAGSFSPTTTLYTPPTDRSMSSPQNIKIATLDLIDLSDENFPPLQATLPRVKAPACRTAGHRHRTLQTKEPRLKGWARLRRNAPPALRMAPIEEEVTGSKHHYVLEFGDEDGLVKPNLAHLRRENTPEQRRQLLDLLMNGS